MPSEESSNLLNKDLVFEFFWKFSAFECGLKRKKKYLKKGKHDAAEPNWDKFENDIRGRFEEISTPGFAEAVDKLIALKPRQQVVSLSGDLIWSEGSCNQNMFREKFVLRLVKTVRNNLFHGGKYPDGPIEEIARNEKILRAALTVLEGCSELDKDISRVVKEKKNEMISQHSEAII